MNPNQSLGMVGRHEWMKVLNAPNGRTVRRACEIPFECAECGYLGTYTEASDDNSRICESCYESALAEIDAQDGA